MLLNNMNFETILEDCKARYKGFNKEITKDRKPKSFENAIKRKILEGKIPIITEIKPSSPLGVLKENPKIANIAKEMHLGGACALSVLTESKFFGGSLTNLNIVSKKSSLPILRKDFIFEESQIYESYYYGADSILLISSFFEHRTLSSLVKISRELGMEPLVEVHSKEDIDKAKKIGARIYVINNRDKDTLSINLDNTKKLSKHIDKIKISASGISNISDLRSVKLYCDAFLIGSALMKSENIQKIMESFING